MLRGINPIVCPELLKVLAEMGHGDEIVLADAHFPGHTFCEKVIRGDGLQIPDLLEGIIPLFELDAYDDPLIMMAAVEGDELDPQVETDYMAAIRKHAPDAPAPVRMDRFAFYDRAEKAFACVITGELAKYGNMILKKGVTPAVCFSDQ
ncbi:MAG: L-fucose mutarotase [Kiritimatiellales bacterium]|nr:L-fucose mutarotase [Kiritimatiellales bacterium]